MILNIYVIDFMISEKNQYNLVTVLMTVPLFIRGLKRGIELKLFKVNNHGVFKKV